MPHKYVDLLLPFKNNIYGNKEHISSELIQKWTNQKVLLVGVGEGRTCYPDFVPFTTQEL